MKKIILVLGDPNSINSEIIYKVWRKSNKNIKKNIFLIGNYKLLISQLKKLNLKIKIKKTQSINDKSNVGLKILDVPLKFKNPFKVSSKTSSRYVIKSLNLAHNICIKNKLGGFINCPIDKKLLNSTKVIGVTEFLAKKNGIRNSSEVMMIYNEKLAVVPITTHINISKVAKNINHNLLLKKLTTLNNFYRKLFKRKPKICLLGLNPHNGELLKSSEEIKILIPAITRLKRLNLNISGPHVADTIFIKNYKNYDVVVGMYHDQVLAPFKAMFNFDAVNITLGLNYIRISPDHGTAVDLIRKNKADFTSLLKCINFMKKIT
tara:strand:- start:7 stop:966 length:960 start_codon:yes stop_codon:yes gene_type:complete